MLQKNAHLRGISALHLCERIAGLRSPGKGANRTILDCLIRPPGAENAVFLPPRGSRAPAAFPGARSAFPGRFHRLRIGKGLES